ncbi:MAG: hypothetical protein IZT56_12335 [Bacteroidetes bacterium]|nr:hypothetical protein [Bacteroidota bacterium]
MGLPGGLFTATGFEVLEIYSDTKNYCFDDLGVEPMGSHYAKECNVMGEILLSRHELFSQPLQNRKETTHLTTNLNAKELEKIYGSRVRSRLREMFNLISFDSASVDKRN